MTLIDNTIPELPDARDRSEEEAQLHVGARYGGKLMGGKLVDLLAKLG